MISIYGLIDPRNNKIRYIGKSVNPFDRLRQHILNAKKGIKTYNYDWIRSLLKIGLKPAITILDEKLNEDEWRDAEKYWINKFESSGQKLTNLAPGGLGGEFTEEVRIKMSNSQKRLWTNPKHKKRMSEAQKRYYENNPEAREKISRESKKRMSNPEYKKKLSQSLKGRSAWNKGKPFEQIRGRTISEETKEKIRQKIKMKWANPEYKKQLRESMEKVWNNPERCKKISIGRKKHFENPENRKKLSETIKDTYAKRKSNEPVSIL